MAKGNDREVAHAHASGRMKETMSVRSFDVSGKVAMVTRTSRGSGEVAATALAKAVADD
ncbi:MAG: hypothetical protein P8182_10040 [Deltaproteobacteria bacterium]